MANFENLKIVVYTRQDCHLCDEALHLLAQNGLIATTVDIDEDEKLVARYNQCVPVVTINGKERFRGRVNEMLLRRILARGEPL